VYHPYPYTNYIRYWLDKPIHEGSGTSIKPSTSQFPLSDLVRTKKQAIKKEKNESEEAEW
jgi:hypothetical protein